MKARVVGLGRRWAGDDAVGPLVIDALHEQSPLDIELVEANDPSDLVELVQTRLPVVLVDAAVGSDRIGEVEVLSLEALEARGRTALSSHGVDVPTAVRLARTLAGEGAICPRFHIVAVHVPAPDAEAPRLHEPVRAAIPEAARRVRALCDSV